MAMANTERFRAMLEDFDTSGVEAALIHVDPEITWNAPPEWLEKRVYSGYDGLRELAADWDENFEEYRLDVERLEDLGEDRVFALVTQRGKIMGSGVEIEQGVAFVAQIRDERVFRVDVFFSWEAGLEAAGLRE